MTISILLFPQFHYDFVPLETVKKIAKHCCDNDIEIDIGYELKDETIPKIKDQLTLAELRSEYFKEEIPEKKLQIKQEIMQSSHFKKLEEYLRKNRKIELEEQFEKYITEDPHIVKCIDSYRVNKTIMDLLENYQRFLIEKKIDKLDNEYQKLINIPTLQSDEDQIKLFVKYEDERIQHMSQTILEKVIEKKSADPIKDCLILIANLGVKHVARLQETLKEKLFAQHQQNIEIFSLKILPNDMREKVGEDDFAKAVGDYDKLKDVINGIPTIYHNDLDTHPGDFDNAQQQIDKALKTLNLKPVSIYVSDKEGPLIPCELASVRSNLAKKLVSAPSISHH